MATKAPKVVVFKAEIEAGAEELATTLIERVAAHYPTQMIDVPEAEALGGKVKCYMMPEHALKGVMHVAFMEGAALAQTKTLETVDQVMKGKPGNKFQN